MANGECVTQHSQNDGEIPGKRLGTIVLRGDIGDNRSTGRYWENDWGQSFYTVVGNLLGWLLVDFQMLLELQTGSR